LTFFTLNHAGSTLTAGATGIGEVSAYKMGQHLIIA
jgi:hypothetical protein